MKSLGFGTLEVRPDARPLNPEAILEALSRNNVECVIIGSFGAILHGIQLEITDIDLVPRLSDENIRALARALSELGVDEDHGTGLAVIKFLGEMPEFIRSSKIWTFLTESGEVDVTLSPDGFPEGYDALVDEAQAGGGLGSSVLVASLEDIARSKEVAGRDKDREALKKFPVTVRSRPPIPLPPLPKQNELTMRMRGYKSRTGLVLRPTTDRRTGKTVMRWMRPS